MQVQCVLPQKSDGAGATLLKIHIFVESDQEVALFQIAVIILLIEVAVCSCLIVNPVLFGITHSMTAGNLACRPGFV